MKIAVTSEDRRLITSHAGHCRGFYVYEVEAGQIGARTWSGIAPEQTLHASHHQLPEALRGIGALVTGGMGSGLFQRLRETGVEPVITPERDPDRAVAAFLAGALPTSPPHAHHTGEHHH